MAQRKIIWAPQALSDLKRIFSYIGQDDPAAAGEWVREVLKRVERLARFPQMGRTIPEIGEGRYRELIVGPYRIFHEILKQEARIFGILHAKQLFPASF